MEKPVYHRVLLKISGEALAGDKHSGLDFEVIGQVCDVIKKCLDMGVQVGLVVGGGNFWRGAKNSGGGKMERTRADHIGMLATVMNCLAVADVCEQKGIPVRVQTALEMRAIAEPYIRSRAIRHLEKGRVVIFGAGTGNPYFSTDTAAVLRAAEIDADVILLAKNVDGVYTADPRIVPNARKMEEVTYDEMLEMASLGAKVLHSRCVEIAKKYGVELLVCSSLNRNSGTMVREKTKMEKMLISGVAADKNVAKIRVAGLGNDPESTFRLLNLLDRNNLNIDVMIQSLGKDGTKSVSFTVAKPDMLRTIDVLNDNKDLLGIKKLDYDENVAKISVIGAGVRSHSGVAAKMFGALANAGINTEMITTSEIRITALIDEAYADQAMRAIHETFLERV